MRSLFELKVPFFDYQRVFSDSRSDFLAIFDEVAQRGAFILQRDVTEFEQELCGYTGASCAVGVANGTDAIEIILQQLKLRPGDEVIISAHTMIATASAVKAAGAVPVVCDIDIRTGLIDPDSVESLINANTVGMVPTQLNGMICDMDRLLAIADKFGLFLVEDSAQGFGARYKDIHAGLFGMAGTLSFFPAKTIGGLGDGGAVITNDMALAEAVYAAHEHGRNAAGEFVSWGRNSRLDNIQAAFLKYRLMHQADDIVAKRRLLAAAYEAGLSGVENIQRPRPPSDTSDYFDSYQNYEILAPERDHLKSWLAERGVGTLIQWSGYTLNNIPALGLVSDAPNVDKYFRDCLLLPMNQFLSIEHVSHVCGLINEFYDSI